MNRIQMQLSIAMLTLLFALSPAARLGSSTKKQLKQADARPTFTVSHLQRLDVVSGRSEHEAGRSHRSAWHHLRSGTGIVAAATPHPKMLGTKLSKRQMRLLEASRLGRKHNLQKSNLRFGSILSTQRTRAGGRSKVTTVTRLFDVAHTEYVGAVDIGRVDSEVESSLHVVYDTGSADFWVASDLCRDGPCTEHGRKRYNHSRSTTFHAPLQETTLNTVYGSGSFDGKLGFDDVHVGPMTARGQTIGMVSREKGSAFEDLPLDGIVGLGFPSLAAESMVPLVDTLMREDQLPQSQFAFYLSHNANNGGAILWGGFDDRFYDGPLTWFPVIDNEFWSLKLLSFKIGNETAPTHKTMPTKVLVDSGTTFFTVPASVMSQVNRHAPETECDQLSTLPDMTYTLEDVSGNPFDIVVKPQEYMVGSDSPIGVFCLAAFVSQEDEDSSDDTDGFHGDPLFIIGEVFMRHHFTVFQRSVSKPNEGDPGARIAVAKSAKGDAAGGVLAELSGSRPR
eukprot:TRINITY_DN80210_c0_g1_i1.p1 TRINITY_DN80210_c0_g1~~TRINITY_DN80210_c0_g1_i1.p1  ORF type:complete len:508 (+),score=83.49 TRINITY_DN80210_c0_g1_i1:91-1614(+)